MFDVLNNFDYESNKINIPASIREELIQLKK
jgi:hypothetical protein